MKRITTPRLVLEPVTNVNAVTLWRIMQSANLREFQDVPRYTKEEFERRVAARPKRFDSRATGRFEWLVVVAQTQQAVGWVSLRVGDLARGTAEIGYSLLAGHRASGYATEATRGVVDFAFAESDLERVDACCVPANLASRRLLARLGFAERRVQHRGAIVRGKPVDIVLFECSRDSWLARAERAECRESAAGAPDYARSANSIVMPASAKPK